MRARSLLLLSNDRSLRATLGSTFQDAGYSVQEATHVDDAHQKFAAAKRATLVLADAQLGPTLWEFCAAQAGDQGGSPVVVLAYDPQDIEQARAAGVAACLQLPLPLVDIVACVDQLTSQGDTADTVRVVNSTYLEPKERKP